MTLFTVLAALMVTLTAGAALAALNRIECPNRPNGSCFGTSSADIILGTDRAEVIGAGLGDDRVRAYGGDDTVKGNDGADTLYGFAGGDTLKGSKDNDFISGAAGGDEIYGGPADDRTRGGGGADTIRVAGDASNRDYVNCGSGNHDTAYVDSNDVVDEAQADTLVVNTGLSCERLYVNGILIPTP